MKKDSTTYSSQLINTLTLLLAKLLYKSNVDYEIVKL